MGETCEFCGTGNFAHKRLVCGAQVARLEAELAGVQKELESKDEELRLAREDFSPEAWEDLLQRLEKSEAAIRAKDAALQMWDDFDNIPGREFDEKYPWLAGTNYDFQERLMYAFTRATLDALKGVE